MKQAPVLESARARYEQILELGFDPHHLTAQEQEELLEIHSALEGRRRKEERQTVGG